MKITEMIALGSWSKEVSDINKLMQNGADSLICVLQQDDESVLLMVIEKKI